MLLSSGQACSYPMKGTHAKYGGFAYSSAYAYSVPPGLFTLEQHALASQLGLSDDGGEHWKARRLCERAALEQRGGGPVLVSAWRPFPDVAVTTYLVPPGGAAPNWHLRAHRVAAAGRGVRTADGGFAVCSERAGDGRPLGPYDAAAGEGTRPRLAGHYDDARAAAGAWAAGAEGAFAVSAGRGAVGIRALEGAAVGRRATLVDADPNSNLVEGRTAIPTLLHTVARGESVWYVSAVYAKPGGRREDFLDGWERPPAVPAWLEDEMGRE